MKGTPMGAALEELVYMSGRGLRSRLSKNKKVTKADPLDTESAANPMAEGMTDVEREENMDEVSNPVGEKVSPEEYARLKKLLGC